MTDYYSEMEAAQDVGANKQQKPFTSSDNNDKSTTTTTTSAATTTRGFVNQFRAFTSMALPYFYEQKKARGLFGIMILLTLVNSAVRVVFSYLARDFWSALSDERPDDFYTIMRHFIVAMILLAPINVLYRYSRQLLAIHWREWMTQHVLRLYFANRVYYGLERSFDNHHQHHRTGTSCTSTTSTTCTTGPVVDNPDQRISEDVRSFTEFSLTLFLTVLMSVVDLICFSIVLFTIMPELFLAIALFAACGTILTMIIGRSLVQLNFEKLKKEANFRFGLVRIRENAESIAFLKGERVEHHKVKRRFAMVIENMHALNVAVRNLDFFTTYYSYLTWILPILVVAPHYFAGAVVLGVVQQAAASFSHVLDDLSILVTQWESLTEFSAGIDRLYTFLTVAQDYYYCCSDSHPDNNKTMTTTSPPLKMMMPSPVFSSDETKSKTKESSLLHNHHRPPPPPPLTTYSSIVQQQRRRPTIRILQHNMNMNANNDNALRLQDLTLMTPDHHFPRTLIHNLSLTVPWGENLLICGASGTGKSSLLRAIAGLWNTGSGSIHRPADHQVYFLPQKPYCALGSLRDQLLYPCTTDIIDLDPRNHLDDDEHNNSTLPLSQAQKRQHEQNNSLTNEELLHILRTLDLAELPLRAGDGNPIRGLDTVMDWSNTLSLGEQQRLAFGRILVNRPRFIILDESTSACDLLSERRMYGMLQDMMMATTTTTAAANNSDDGMMEETTTTRVPFPSRVTYVSVGHRPSLLAYHNTKLTLDGDRKWSIEPIEHPSTACTSRESLI